MPPCSGRARRSGVGRASGRWAMRIGSTLLFGIALAGLMPAAAHPAAGPTARGRDLAAQVCSACHVIGSPQPFDPALDPPAPPFREIANRPGVTAAYLRR